MLINTVDTAQPLQVASKALLIDKHCCVETSIGQRRTPIPLLSASLNACLVAANCEASPIVPQRQRRGSVSPLLSPRDVSPAAGVNYEAALHKEVFSFRG